MALVAYDYSDSSDIDENENDTDAIAITNLNDDISKEENLSEPKLTPNSGNNLFNFLPQPTKKSAVEEDEDEFLLKKGTCNNLLRPKAKITVPSLSDFKDIEGSVPKPKMANGKKSGLLSMLPQPKNSVSVTSTTKSFVPHILTKQTATVKKKEPLPPLTKKTKSLAKDYSDDSDDEEVQNDFFSINKTDEVLVENIPLEIDKPGNVVSDTSIKKSISTASNIQSYFKQDIIDNSEMLENEVIKDEEQSRSYQSYEDPTCSNQSEYNVQSSGEIVIDDETILKLCGTRGKRKREEIQIVDVDQKEVLADAKEWLLKGLMDDTTKRVSMSKRRGDEPTSQQRRKHQITYLAHQAKANEAELQNQWANNRMSKRQTQSKYGF